MTVFVSPAEGRVTSEWGRRERHPVTGQRGFHRGIDIAPPIPGQTGVPVRAAYAGTVRTVVTGRPRGDRRPNPVTGTWNTGNCVIIDGAGGGSEFYGHLATVVVAPGDRVSAGTILGTMGASGNVSGIHLHFECWDGRTQGGGAAGGNTRNPRVDFKRHGVTPGAAYAPPKNTPSPLPTPSPVQEDIMASLSDLSRVVGESNALHVEKLRIALQDDIRRITDDVVRRRDNTQNAALHNAFKREILAAVGAIPGVDVGALSVRLADALTADLTAAITEAAAERPAATAAETADLVVTKIANRLTEGN